MSLAQHRYENLVRDLRQAELALLTVQNEMEKFMIEYRASLAGRKSVTFAGERHSKTSVIEIIREYIATLESGTYFTTGDVIEACCFHRETDLARFRRGLAQAVGNLVFSNELERAGEDGYRVLKLTIS